MASVEVASVDLGRMASVEVGRDALAPVLPVAPINEGSKPLCHGTGDSNLPAPNPLTRKEWPR